jgi:hypothetical protein
MVRFIKQEAEEKANEIKVSAEEVRRGGARARSGAERCGGAAAPPPPRAPGAARLYPRPRHHCCQARRLRRQLRGVGPARPDDAAARPRSGGARPGRARRQAAGPRGARSAARAPPCRPCGPRGPRRGRRAPCARAPPQEFNLEKLQLLEQEKAKIRKEYERRESQVDVKKKMCAPAAWRRRGSFPAARGAAARMAARPLLHATCMAAVACNGGSSHALTPIGPPPRRPQ